MDFGFLMIGVMLIIAGLFVLLTAYIMEHAGRESGPGEGGGRVRGGGVVIVGPVPIVFGTDKGAAVIAAIVGAVLTVIALVTWLMISHGGWWP